jgi:hypothetical protein
MMVIIQLGRVIPYHVDVGPSLPKMDMDPEYVRFKVSGEIFATIILGLVMLAVTMCLLSET